jgi:hypothetical protein
MAIGKISGPMLQTNLARQGVDLSVDTNLVYFDVTNRRLGIGITAPSYTLDISGNAHLGNLYILGNTVTSDTGVINFGTTSNITIGGGSPNYVLTTDGNGNIRWDTVSNLTFSFGNISLVGDAISTTNTNGNLILSPNGTGVISTSNTRIINLATPIASTDAVNKSYVDTTFANVAVSYIKNGTASNVAALASGNVTISINGTTQAYFASGISQIDNVSIQSATITSTIGDLQLGGLTTNNKVIFDNTSAISLPAGGSLARPASGVSGDFRYNSDFSVLEYYVSGTGWISLTNGIHSQMITPDGTSQSYTLNYTATAASIIVSINGTVQQPSISYTVSGTTITFAEVPTTTDIIDIRFIASVVTTVTDFETVDTANVTVGTANVTLDSFDATAYRSAKYTISSTSAVDAHMADVQIVQFNGTATLNAFGILNTGTNTINYYTTISGNTVSLLAKGTTSSNQVRIQKTYFLI